MQDQTWLQLTMPTSAGGCQLTSATDAAEAAHLACTLQCLPAARAHLRRLLPEESTEVILQAVDITQTREIQDRLRTNGILQDSPAPTDLEGKHLQQIGVPLETPFKPLAGMQGPIAQAAARQRMATLRKDSDDRSKVRLDACTGAGSGAWCTVIPASDQTRLTDAEFLSAMRWRLGMRQAASNVRCQHVAAKSQKQCPAFLDPYLDHAVLCKSGQGVYRLHNTLAHKLREFAREAGCEAHSEVTVPSLTKFPGTDQAEEARLDVHIWAGGAWPLELLVDATTRHPWAARYRQASLAATTAAVTTADRRAASQKEGRYGKMTQGAPIVVAVLGTWGRLSEGLLDLLDLLARRAAHARADSGVHAFGRQRRWVEEIAIAQQRCLHRQFSTALPADCISSITVPSGAQPV